MLHTVTANFSNCQPEEDGKRDRGKAMGNRKWERGRETEWEVEKGRGNGKGDGKWEKRKGNGKGDGKLFIRIYHNSAVHCTHLVLHTVTASFGKCHTKGNVNIDSAGPVQVKNNGKMS